jgi:hypothetical protein
MLIENEQSRDSINIEHKTRTKKRKRKTKSRMNNPETQSTLGTKQERRKQEKNKIKNEQSRDDFVFL